MKIRSRFTRFAPLLIFLFFSGLGQADAGFLNLSSLQHGEIATTQLPGVTISADNFGDGRLNNAINFDSRLTGTLDSDLEEPPNINWLPGNFGAFSGLDTNTELSNLLTIAENDEGSNPAGTITFDFNIPNLSFGIDLVDIEQSSADNAGTFVEFFDRGSSISAESPNYTGNNSLNRIEPFTVSELNSLSNTSITSFNKVVISMGGSGVGISNDWVPPVPKPTTMQPTTVLLFGFGLVGVGGFAGFRRKFRKI